LDLRTKIGDIYRQWVAIDFVRMSGRQG